MPGDPKECRENAKCCLDIANSAPSLMGKLRFEGLAHSWLRLAEDLEHASVLLEHWGDLKFPKAG